MKTSTVNTTGRMFDELSSHPYANLTIPNFISYCTLLFSLGGVYMLLNGHFLLGALLFWTICDVFDTLDGFVAKKFNMFSPLGADLDSLIDVIAFLIPPFLIGLQSGNRFLLIASFLFVFSGIYRLARFNVEKNPKGVVVGLQASLAAHLVYLSLLIDVSSGAVATVMIVLSLLMISPVKSKANHSLLLTGLLMGLNILLITLKIVS
jgi:CDP-diacylglycerol--serine O-phosphatidyltransferase